MGNFLYRFAFVVAVGYALTLGIFIKTGQSIDPIDIIIDLFNSLISILGDPTGLLTNYRNLLALISSVLLILDLFLIVIAGVDSIVSAVFGFFGMLMLVLDFPPIIGALIFIIGGTIAILAPDPNES
jgi:hypothetical protein